MAFYASFDQDGAILLVLPLAYILSCLSSNLPGGRQLLSMWHISPPPPPAAVTVAGWGDFPWLRGMAGQLLQSAVTHATSMLWPAAVYSSPSHVSVMQCNGCNRLELP